MVAAARCSDTMKRLVAASQPGAQRLMHNHKLNRLRVNNRRELPPGFWCAAISNDFVASDKTSVLREIATTMYLLAILRWVLELTSGTTQLRRATGIRAIGQGCLRAQLTVKLLTLKLLLSKWLPCAANTRAKRARADRGVPQDWISMDYVLSESSAADRLLRGPFERPTHPLAALVRIVRRLAGVPQACPALVPTRSITNPRASGRRP
jgi:hypothetical protein